MSAEDRESTDRLIAIDELSRRCTIRAVSGRCCERLRRFAPAGFAAMSIEDVRTLPGGSSVDADICIVGGGPAGLTLAAELSGHGAKVVLLESGGRERDPWAESMNEIVSVGTPRVLDQELVRNRGLGGSTATWGGRLATLSEIDFRERSWVPGSGWPISREDLEPYYSRAAVRLGAIVSDNNAAEAVEFVAKHVPATNRDLLVPYLWTFSRHDATSRDFMRHGKHAQESGLENVACFVHATVTQIETNDSGRAVQRLEVRGPDGHTRWVIARNVVLCGGGIENAHLLLASNRTNRAGVGNDRGLVGRFLMDHRRGPAAWFAPHDGVPVQRVFGDFHLKASRLPKTVTPLGTTGAGRMTPGYALSPAVQESDQLLNCAVFIDATPTEDDPLDSALRLLRAENPVRNLKHLAQHPALAVGAFARPIVSGRFPVRLVTGLSLLCIVEQRPDADSRITLADRSDVLGVPLAQVDWRVSQQESLTVRRTVRLFIEEMRRLGVPVPTPTATVANDEEDCFLPDVAHPSGTTRMSLDERSGVVDANCAVHGVKGLYVVGSSVFPTNGHANPTHTIVALAIRLADHLKVELGPARRDDSPAPRISTPKPVQAPISDLLNAQPNSRPTVLVTGASGRIGKRVVDFLLRDGFSVRALTSRIPMDQTDGVDWRIHDLRQMDMDFHDDARGCVGIIHLAAEQAHEEDMIRVNVEATGALARAAESEGVPVMVYTSSMSVYGSPSDSVMTEESSVMTVQRDVPSEYWDTPKKRTYGRTKLGGELAIKAVARDVEYVILRPTQVYGPTDLVDMAHWSSRARAALWKQHSHAINVDDVAETVVWALRRSLGRTSPQPGISTYNVSDEGRAHTYGDFWQAFNEALDPPPSRVPFAVPGIVVWALSWMWRRGPRRRLVGLVTVPATKLQAEGCDIRYGLTALTAQAIEEMRATAL